MKKYYIRGLFCTPSDWIEATAGEYEDYKKQVVETLLGIPGATREAVEWFASQYYKTEECTPTPRLLIPKIHKSTLDEWRKEIESIPESEKQKVQRMELPSTVPLGPMRSITLKLSGDETTPT